ncbi:hypothetical protein BY458DRAFT_532998 [Sporodiniella umbellata]|nr:hypothetical protein BY458DRAFT_532998 [Sporodiniella umbellata]
MDLNRALVSFFDKEGRKTLYSFVIKHAPLVGKYICQFSKIAHTRKSLVYKFQSKYKAKKNPKSKRSPLINFYFDMLWSSTQVNNTLANEGDKVFIEFIKSSSVEEDEKKSNSEDNYSNKRGDNVSDESLVYPNKFTGIVLSDEEVSIYLKQFKQFQLKV